jgi:hypothetical protein
VGAGLGLQPPEEEEPGGRGRPEGAGRGGRGGGGVEDRGLGRPHRALQLAERRAEQRQRGQERRACPTPPPPKAGPPAPGARGRGFFYRHSGKRITRILSLSQKAHRLPDSKSHSQCSLSWLSLVAVLTIS